jgi:hypothetical protein
VNVVVWTRLPEVAVTVTVEVPGLTGVGTPDGFGEPPHPTMLNRTISMAIEPLKIAVDFKALRRRQIGNRPASPNGKIALAVTMGSTENPPPSLAE